MTRFGVLLFLTGAATLTATASSVAQKQDLLGASTTGFLPCDNPSDDVAGVIRIWLPSSIDLANLPNDAVRFNKQHINDGTAVDPINPKDDAEIEPINGQKEPFHVYMKKANFAKTGYIAVRVIAPANRNYEFYDQRKGYFTSLDIHGVGVSDLVSTNSICGNKRVRELDDGRHVARFRIDLSKIGRRDRSFNIGIVPNSAKDTPIFIDPRIRNDG